MNTDYEQSYGIVKTQVQFAYVLGVTLIVINVLMIFVKWLRTPTFAILDLLFGIPFLLLLPSIRSRFKSVHSSRLDMSNNALWKRYRRLVYSLNRVITLVLIIIGICTAFHIYRRTQDESHFQELLAEADEMGHKYSELLPPAIAERMKNMEYVRDVKVNASMSLTRDSRGDYTWNEKVRITLYLDDAFDSISDDTQYDFLCEEASKGSDAIYDATETYLPELYDLHRELRHIIEDERNGFMWGNTDNDYDARTSENHYEYAHYVKDYFVKNDKDHFTSKHLAEIQAKYAKPTPTPKPVKNNNYTNKGSTSKSNTTNTGRSTSGSANKSTGGKSATTNRNPLAAYDEGYEDIWLNDDYDWDRYYRDQDYADGVDDAMEDEDW